MKIEIGGGDNPRDKTALQMDLYLPSAEVKHDANKIPYPFEENQFEGIYASHVIEHLDIHEKDNFKRIMKEWTRIVKPGGIIKIWTPYAASIAAVWSNPEHKRPFVYHSFDWGDPNLLGSGSSNSRKEWYRHDNLWKVRKVRINFGKVHRIFGVEWLANKYPDFYEHFLYGIFPAREIYYELEVLK